MMITPTSKVFLKEDHPLYSTRQSMINPPGYLRVYRNLIHPWSYVTKSPTAEAPLLSPGLQAAISAWCSPTWPHSKPKIAEASRGGLPACQSYHDILTREKQMCFPLPSSKKGRPQYYTWIPQVYQGQLVLGLKGGHWPKMYSERAWVQVQVN